MLRAALFLMFWMVACVPKAQYEDQNNQLKKAKQTIDELEEAKKVCDPDTFLQLQEQSQSLDLLQQELIDRNTELAEEVARLRVYEAQVKGEGLEWEEREQMLRKEFEKELARTKQTYEDLIEELEKELEKLKNKL